MMCILSGVKSAPGSTAFAARMNDTSRGVLHGHDPSPLRGYYVLFGVTSLQGCCRVRSVVDELRQGESHGARRPGLR